MKKTQWMKVSNDKFELPIASADSARELAKMLGISENTIYAALSHKKDGMKTCYIKVEIEIGFDDEEKRS